MDNQTKDQIRDLVSRAKLDKALEMFGNWADSKGDKDLKNAIFLKKSDWKDLKNDENLGMISSGDANIRRNKIAGAILSLLDDAEEATPEVPKTGSTRATPVIESSNTVANQANKNNGTILFLASNPTDTAKLQLDKEFVQVFQNIGDNRVTYVLKAEFAVTSSSLQTALLKYRPRIVHFSGHGEGGSGGATSDEDTRAIGKIPKDRTGIVLQTSDGKTQLVPGAALANLFKICLRIFKLEVVLLNACSSEEQAAAIFNAGIPFVIGMNAAVKDASAIQFSAKFYEGLASEGDVEIAFELAKAGVMMENGFSNDADIPVLYKKEV